MKIRKLNLFSDFHFQIENGNHRVISDFLFQIRKGNLNCGIVHAPYLVNAGREELSGGRQKSYEGQSKITECFYFAIPQHRVTTAKHRKEGNNNTKLNPS